MSLSINTNVGAITALSVLSQTNKSLETAQARISSGLRVATAKDDAASYSIASKMRADVAGYGAVQRGLGLAESTLGTAIKAGEAIKNLLVEMKAKAVQAQGGGLTDADRLALDNDVNKLQDQIDNIVNTASFNDTNLVSSSAENISVVADVSGTSSITIEAKKLDQETLGLKLAAHANNTDSTLATIYDEVQTAIASNAAATTVTNKYNYLDVGNPSTPEYRLRDQVAMIDLTTGDGTAQNDIAESAEKIDAAIDTVTSALAYFGSVAKQIEVQSDFTQGLMDQLNIGIGILVDADMAQESAMLQSLQIKQNLGTQALGIANAAPQTILGLFG